MSTADKIVIPAGAFGKVYMSNEGKVCPSARSVRECICLSFSVVQTERRRSEVCSKKQKANTFPYRPSKRKTSFWFIFVSGYSAVFVFRCWRLPYLWVSWFRFMLTLVRHSFKQLSRKATLMFQDVLLFELFQRTLPNPFFLFSFKSTYSRQNIQFRKKAYCPIKYHFENVSFDWLKAAFL